MRNLRGGKGVKKYVFTPSPKFVVCGPLWLLRRELDSVIRVTRAARDGRKEGAKCIKT